MGLIVFFWRNRWLQAIAPYALVVLGIWLALEMVPIVFSREETSPTSVSIAQLSEKNPSQRWLTLTGGGYYLAGAVGEFGRLKSPDVANARRCYIPILTPAEANAWTHAGEGPPAGTKKILLACLTPEEFRTLFPNFGNRRVRPEYYRLAELPGTRAWHIPAKVKNFVRDEYRVDSDGITIFQLNAKPAKPSDAFTALVLGVAMTIVGGIWTGFRLKEGVPDVEDNYVPPVPEMPEGGWNARDYRKAG